MFLQRLYSFWDKFFSGINVSIEISRCGSSTTFSSSFRGVVLGQSDTEEEHESWLRTFQTEKAQKY